MSKSGFFKDWTNFMPLIKDFIITSISKTFRAERRIPQVDCLEWIEAKWSCSRCTAYYKLMDVVEEYSDLQKEKEEGYSNYVRRTAFIKYLGKLNKVSKDHGEWWR